MKKDREPEVLEDEMLRCATLSHIKDIIPHNSLQVLVKNERRIEKKHSVLRQQIEQDKFRNKLR
jgi:hypothetical protein